MRLIVIGAHAEGEVGNVVIDGVGDIPGSTMLEKRDYLREHKDHIRKTLLFEPRGAPYHAANIIFPSNNPSADIGFVCAEVSKYPLMSGSNLICVATVVLETGIVAMHEPVTTLAIESPGGLIITECECKDGKVTRVSFRNVPCVPIFIDQEIELEGARVISVDIAYGGIIYAIVDAHSLGFRLHEDEVQNMCRLGKVIKMACNRDLSPVHPDDASISGVDNVIFAGALETDGDHLKARSATVCNGRIDRSPCGTGTAARLSIMYATDQIEIGQEFHSFSMRDTCFIARVEDEVSVAGRRAIIPRLSGQAWITGRMEYFVDPSDQIQSGHRFNDVWPRW